MHCTLDFDRKVVRSRITDRLEERLKGGMIVLDENLKILAKPTSLSDL